MSLPPKVSIVVPARNAAGDIDRLLDALEKLDWPREATEVVVIDDASTDDTRERIAAHPNVQLVPNEERKGPYASRNIGAARATGDWIAFTDADCAPDPRWPRRSHRDGFEICHLGSRSARQPVSGTGGQGTSGA